MKTKEQRIQQLIEASEFAALVLAGMPQYGKTIGKKVTKEQIRIAQGRLMIALTALNSK